MQAALHSPGCSPPRSLFQAARQQPVFDTERSGSRETRTTNVDVTVGWGVGGEEANLENGGSDEANLALL